MGIFKSVKLMVFVIMFMIVFSAVSAAAVFGAMPMSHGEQNHGGGCLVATMQNFDCASARSPFEYLGHQFKALQGISSAVFPSYLVLVSFFFAVLSVGNFSKPRNAFIKFHFVFAAVSDRIDTIFRKPLLRWIALCEKRDPEAVFS